MKSYAGIGSRQTPPDVLARMTELARRGEARGFVLRSGGANGADEAFEAGVLDYRMKEIYLPWRGFNRSISSLCEPPAKAMLIAKEFHPAWSSLSPAAHKLMARNVLQILGQGLDDPVRFVICWTPDGADGVTIKTSGRTGGTGQAIRIAAAHGIPVYNLANIP